MSFYLIAWKIYIQQAQNYKIFVKSTLSEPDKNNKATVYQTSKNQSGINKKQNVPLCMYT